MFHRGVFSYALQINPIGNPMNDYDDNAILLNFREPNEEELGAITNKWFKPSECIVVGYLGDLRERERTPGDMSQLFIVDKVEKDECVRKSVSPGDS